MIKEKTVYIIMVGIVITFVMYLFLDALIDQNFKLLVFILILVIIEASIFKIFYKQDKKKEKSEDQFEKLFEDK